MKKKMEKYAMLVAYKNGKEDSIVVHLPNSLEKTYPSITNYLNNLDLEVGELIVFKKFKGYPLCF